LPAARWTAVETMHLTFKFLGEMQEAGVARLVESLRRSTARAPARCRATVRGLGVFPHQKRPRVLWAGVMEETPGGLSALHRWIEDAAAEAGCAREDRPFHPHLTLARLGERTAAGPVAQLVR